MSNPDTSRRSLQVEHITTRSNQGFAEVKNRLERLVPKLDDDIFQLIASGRSSEWEQKLADGPELSIFPSRDHGGLLRITGRASNAVQYEIGNPLTASGMTRHHLAAGLYAPLRVILYESETGGSVVEYDKPSSLFGQFGDEAISDVARGLDAALASALQRAMEPS